MTYPNEPFPRGPTEWQPRSNGSSDYGDLRERLARLETAAGYTQQAIRSHHDRLLTGDGRFSRLEDRQTSIEQEGRRAIEDLAKVKELPKRIEAIEARSKAWKDVLQYAAGFLVMALALAGKIEMPEALKLFGKSIGLG